MSLSEEGYKYNVLVAEDDEDDFQFIRDIVREKCPEIRLIWARNGEELLAYLRSGFDAQSICLILLDLNMPRKDGREALREIKEDPKFADIPVTVFTTADFVPDKKYIKSFRKTQFVTKPIGYTKYVDFAKSLVNLCEQEAIPDNA